MEPDADMVADVLAAVFSAAVAGGVNHVFKSISFEVDEKGDFKVIATDPEGKATEAAVPAAEVAAALGMEDSGAPEGEAAAPAQAPPPAAPPAK